MVIESGHVASAVACRQSPSLGGAKLGAIIVKERMLRGRLWKIHCNNNVRRGVRCVGCSFPRQPRTGKQTWGIDCPCYCTVYMCAPRSFARIDLVFFCCVWVSRGTLFQEKHTDFATDALVAMYHERILRDGVQSQDLRWHSTSLLR